MEFAGRKQSRSPGIPVKLSSATSSHSFRLSSSRQNSGREIHFFLPCNLQDIRITNSAAPKSTNAGSDLVFTGTDLVVGPEIKFGSMIRLPSDPGSRMGLFHLKGEPKEPKRD